MFSGTDPAGQFARSLEEANRFTLDRAVRAYQREIIETGRFTVVSPATGEAVAPGVCHVANNGDHAHGDIGIAYRLPGEAAIWLLASSTRDGFPITEAYEAREGASLWSLGEGYRGENRRWKARLTELEQSRGAEALPAADCAQPVVLMGHPNFAHQLWNELAALFLYTGECRAEAGTLSINSIYQPLLPLANFSGGATLRVSPIASFDALTGFQARMVTRLGSTRIPVALRETVIAKVAQQRDPGVTDSCMARLRGRRPVIWLSLRLDARTADNQEAFLERLMAGVAERFPAAGFILDGFSYPSDFGSAIYSLADGGVAGHRPMLRRLLPRRTGYLARAMRSRERAITTCISRFSDRLRKHLSNPIVNVSGMRLVDSVYLGRQADYYVCHAGTLQHKIAWIYNIPGAVHSNTTGVGKGTGRWLANQLEGGRQPFMVPPDYIEDLDTIRTANQVERNRDYHIRDIESVVAQIIDDMSVQTLPARSGASG